MSPAPFETASSDVDGVRVIAVRGELDLSTAPGLEPRLEEALEGEQPVTIDLTACEFIDSTGIALIVRAWQRLGANDGGRQLAIATNNDQVQRVLEISGLDRSIPIHPDRETAVAALKSSPASSGSGA